MRSGRDSLPIGANSYLMRYIGKGLSGWIRCLRCRSSTARGWRMRAGGWACLAIGRKFVASDGTVRYLVELADGETVETVWMPEGDGGESGDGSEAGDEAELWPRGHASLQWRLRLC